MIIISLHRLHYVGKATHFIYLPWKISQISDIIRQWNYCGNLSDGHEGMVSERVSKMRDGTIAPLTSLPQNEGRQFLGSYPFPSFTPGYRPQK